MSMHSALSSRDNHVQVFAVITPHDDPRRQNEVLSSFTEVREAQHLRCPWVIYVCMIVGARVGGGVFSSER